MAKAGAVNVSANEFFSASEGIEPTAGDRLRAGFIGAGLAGVLTPSLMVGAQAAQVAASRRALRDQGVLPPSDKTIRTHGELIQDAGQGIKPNFDSMSLLTKSEQAEVWRAWGQSRGMKVKLKEGEPGVLVVESETPVKTKAKPGEAGHLLAKQKVVVYNGFDATGDSLHVGHLVPLLAWRACSDLVTTPSPWRAAEQA